MIGKKEIYCNEVKKIALPLFICNWIFGIGILEYPLGRPRRTLSGLYIASILIIYCSLSMYSYPHIIEFSGQIEANENIAKVFFVCHIFLIISTILLGWLRSERIHSILEQGITANKFLQKIEINEDSQKMLKSQLRKVIMQVLMIFVIVSIINFSYIYKKQLTTESIISIIIFNYPLIVLSITDATFINLVQYSCLKFKKLNNLLRHVLTSTCDRPQHSKSFRYYETDINPLDKSSKTIIISDKAYTINVARKAHSHFIVFCETVNEVYAIHILISIMAAIFMMTMSFYHSYGVLTSETSKVSINQQILPLMSTLVVYSSIKIYLFTKCCSDVTQETIAAGDIISEIYDGIINEESQNEIRNFEIQLIQHPLKFHLCNLIALDYSLTQKVIGKVTTYLVILTQCGKVTLQISE